MINMRNYNMIGISKNDEGEVNYLNLVFIGIIILDEIFTILQRTWLFS